MIINKVHCLFEQSGTFKKQFKELGIDAEDYDILNDFEQTDHIVDLFAEIGGGYEGKPSIFDNIAKDDLILAFFPCTRFECQIQMAFAGNQNQQQNWSEEKKLSYSLKLHEELHELYSLLTKLCLVCIRKGLRLVIENPYNQPHYLTMYWCLKPSIIDKDRTLDGDYFKKPTQYFFVNCKPEQNLVFEPIEYVPQKRVEWTTNSDEHNSKVLRSLIHPQYAERFIKKYIL